MSRIITVLSILLPIFASAQPYIPPPLEPWAKWVMERHPELQCAEMGDGRECVWPGRLRLSLNKSGGFFTLFVNLDREEQVLLPGGDELWPLDVDVRGSSAFGLVTLTEASGRPAARLKAGRHEIRGRFQWQESPKSLPIPPEAGLLELELDGKPVANPKITEGGELWLETQDQTEQLAAQDSLRLSISRALYDGVPFRLVTQLSLRVGGKSREVNLGNLLPDGFIATAVESPLAYRLQADDALTLQLKPGEFAVTVEAYSPAPPESLEPSPAADGVTWPVQEFWAWYPNAQLRSVDLRGAPPVDPAQTDLPAEWRNAATYSIKAGEKLLIKESRRGEKDPAPNLLDLRRELWLQLDGQGYSIRDTFSGTMNRDWRLVAQSSTALGSVQVAGVPQLITRIANGTQPGIELRQQQVNVVAQSRISSALTSINAVGWESDVNSLSTTLHLPPGWDVLAARGVDQLSGTWLDSWTLLDVFLVLLISFALGKLIGRRWTWISLLAMTLLHGEPNAPSTLWIHLLVALALIKVLPDGRVRNLIKLYWSGAILLLALMMVSFVYYQVQSALYPQLGSYTEYSGGGMPIRTLAAKSAGVARMPSTAPAPQDYSDSTVADLSFQEQGESTAGNVSAPEENFPDRQQLLTVDPSSVVQTGPAIPTWSFKSWDLRWNGPVKRDATLSLYLISPAMNMCLALARVALALALLAAFAGAARALRGSASSATAVAALLLILALPKAHAQSFPSQELLADLEKRILKEQCQSDCTVVGAVKLTISDSAAQVSALVSTRGGGAWPIPGPWGEFTPKSVRIDDVESNALRRDERGLIWVRVPDGTHRVAVTGELARRDTITLQLGIIPGHLELQSQDWESSDITPSGGVGDSIQLSRLNNAPAQASQDPESSPNEELLPRWYELERNFQIGVPWTVHSTLRRYGDKTRAETVSIPLLEGEGITNPELTTHEGVVQIALGRDQDSYRWTSSLSERAKLLLTAEGAQHLTHRWRFSCSPVWRCRFEGLVPTRHVSDGVFSPHFNPWPGDKLTVAFSRPPSAGGVSSTIDTLNLSFTPGTRSLQAELSLAIRSSQGGSRELKLPEGVEVQRHNVNGAELSVQPNERVVQLPISPGMNNYTIAWQQPWKFSLIQRLPSVELADAANLNITANIPEQRWVLYLRGPAWGPAVLFWIKLLAVVVFAAALGRSRLTPLGTTGWLLLGLGLSTLNVETMAIPVIWLFALGWRGRKPLTGRWRFNFMQIGLVILTLMAFSALYEAIHHGLILYPDMQISGNNSYGGTLRWYQDHAESATPTATIVSAPMWVWRMLMLAWSAWLVFALLKWLRWGWDCFGAGGMWRAGAAKTATTAAVPPSSKKATQEEFEPTY